MVRMLISCLLLNLACVGACAALLLFYPRNSGFTTSDPRSTHYLAGGEILSAALLSIVDVAIGVYLAWSLLYTR